MPIEFLSGIAPNVTNTDIVLSGAGAGIALTLSASSDLSILAVQGISFDTDAGPELSAFDAVYAPANNLATISLKGCRFFALSSTSGFGADITGALNVSISGCTIIDGLGAYIGPHDFILNAGPTGNIAVQNCVISTNNNIGAADL